MKDLDKPMVAKALNFAIEAYKGIKRKSGEDYVNHPIRVKNYLREIQIKDESILTAALLHDILKETSLTEGMIAKEFNEDVAYMITKLNQISSIQLPMEFEQKKIPNLHKLLIHLSEDMRVLIIRLADRVDNIKTAHCLTNEERQWIAQKAIYLYAPISKSIGLNQYYKLFNREAFKLLNPKRYGKLKNYVDIKLTNADSILKATEERIELITAGFTSHYDISSRRKDIFSIHKKAILKANKGDIKHDEDISGLCDLLGIRILVENEDLCFKIMNEISKQWELIPGEYDDYITNPKPNGYKTLQASIKLDKDFRCEIQIRTYEMHSFNEFGPASHLSYKYGNKISSNNDWIKDLVASKDNIQQGLAKDSKIRLFENEIFVFTPKNQVIALPAKSTIVDFAYAIHSDIGDHCDSGIVNNKQVQLDHELKSGDIIEIKTRKNRLPSKDWLKFVKTNEAKRNIKRYV